jgi:hypothetical protein
MPGKVDRIGGLAVVFGLLLIACTEPERIEHTVDKAGLAGASGTVDPSIWDRFCQIEGLPAGCDLCASLGWYHDRACDSFCPSPDPDCGPVESSCGATVPPAEQIVDANLDVWTITPTDQIARNGVADEVTAAVTLLVYFNGVVYQQATAANRWWAWIDGAWEADPPGGDPRTSQTCAASVNGATVPPAAK